MEIDIQWWIPQLWPIEPSEAINTQRSFEAVTGAVELIQVVRFPALHTVLLATLTLLDRAGNDNDG